MSTITTANQLNFFRTPYLVREKLTRRDLFLAKMSGTVPWNRLIVLTEPHHPKNDKRERLPISISISIERMLRMHFIQRQYGLVDVAIEDTIYDSQALRNSCFPKIKQHD